MAGFFGLFDYSKPGPGISKNAPQKKRFFLFFDILGRKFWKLIQLNFLYILFCLPVVTIGPATAGMTYVLRNFANEQHSFLFSDFWDSFKSNFKQSFIYSILSLIATVLLSVSIYYYYINLNQNKFYYLPFVVSVSIAIIFIFMNYYVYLMIVTLDLKLKAIIKNAFIFSVLGVKTNIITFLILGLIIFATVWYFPITLLFIVLIEFSLVGLIICFNSYQYIKKYAIDPYLNSQNTQNEPVEENEPVFEDTIIENNKD